MAESQSNTPSSFDDLVNPDARGDSYLWNAFGLISRLSRESGQEQMAIAELKKLAEDYKFETKMDEVGNLCIHVPATSGYGSAPAVCLQGHIDMVCVKDPTSTHDFSKDPIDMEIDGDWVKAKGTSLGADNGIGVAAALAAAIDPNCQHPALEILITRDEEDGFTGVDGFDPVALGMKSAIVLNLDTEKLGETYVRSAGFQGLYAKLPIERHADPSKVDTARGDERYFSLELSGLPGGHSGVEIHDIKRVNAIKLMNKVLADIFDRIPSVKLVSFDGGQKVNAIPSEATAVISIPDNVDSMTVFTVLDSKGLLGNKESTPIKNYRHSDSGFSYSHPFVSDGAKFECKELAKEAVTVNTMQDKFASRLMDAIKELPNGVIAVCDDMPGVTETSSNLGVLQTSDGEVSMGISARSFKEDELQALRGRIEGILGSHGFDTERGTMISPWYGDPNSPLVQRLGTAYKTVTGEEAELNGIHGGLEVADVVLKLQRALGQSVDAASIGPTILDVHSTKERVNIPSVETFYEQLKAALASFKPKVLKQSMPYSTSPADDGSDPCI